MKKKTNIKILNAPAGLGKTFVCVDKAVCLAGSGEPVMIVQETMDLIDETYALLNERAKFRAVVGDIEIKRFYSKGGAPVIKELTKELAINTNPYRIVLITKKAFMEIRSRNNNFQEWHCFYDEFIEPFDILTLATEWESAKTFDRLYKDKPDQADLGSYTEVVPSQVLYDVVQQQPNDYTFRSMKEDGIIRALYSDFIRCFLHNRSKKMAIFVTPALFSCFKEVTMLGAKMEYHPVSLFWRDYEMLPSDLNYGLRSINHKGKVALGYFCEYSWTKSYKMFGANMEYVSAALDMNFKDEDYILVESEDIQQYLTMPRFNYSRHKGVTSRGADIIKCKVAGLNGYSEDTGAVFLNSMVMPDYWYRALKEIFDYSFEDIVEYEMMHISYTAYQFILRTSIRNPDFDGIVSAVVGSGIIAGKVAEMIGRDRVQVEKLQSSLNDTTTPETAFAAQRLAWADEQEAKRKRLKGYNNAWLKVFSVFSVKFTRIDPHSVIEEQQDFREAKLNADIESMIDSIERMQMMLNEDPVVPKKTLTPHEMKLKEIIASYLH